MNKLELIKKIKRAAIKDRQNRKDPRYLKTMGFLVAKGLLHTNQPLALMPNARIEIEDAIWAGKNVEPRILEVLPAAILRLKNHFNYNPEVHLEIKETIYAIKNNLPGEFYGIPIKKLKPWLDIKLKDGRTKKMAEKKITKTFRLHPRALKKMAEIKARTGQSDSEIIEDLLD